MAIVLCITLAAFGALLTLQWWENSKPALTGSATVISRRVEAAKWPTHRHNYNFFVTFALSDGDEIELYTSEEEYKQLTEGLTGMLTWQSKNFCDFT